MMALRCGSLFAGYGGIEMGLAQVLPDLDLAWYSEIDRNASLIMERHHPRVPNLGDITKIDWTTVPPVDVLTGGSPCQDLSGAGNRAGMTPGTRSNLWVSMRAAVEALRPPLVVWENVRGAYSACADSLVGYCSRCMGLPGKHDPSLRALGRVLGDLSEIGYDARWYGLEAADVGGAHHRYRVFVFGSLPDAELPRL